MEGNTSHYSLQTVKSRADDKLMIAAVAESPPRPEDSCITSTMAAAEPHTRLEFDSHEEAYTFYQEYAKAMGFTTSIKNSRRSKKSKEFIDAKFACSRYGATTAGESEGVGGRRPGLRRTDCRASMHVKRRADGRWYVHEYINQHNHHLLPALAYHFRIHGNTKFGENTNLDILQAVSDRTRRMYVHMSRMAGEVSRPCRSAPAAGTDSGSGRLSIDQGDARVMLDYFAQAQKENPGFFYAMDLNEGGGLRSLLWADSKSRADYTCFSDTVFFDTTYVREKVPLAVFLGVNHHLHPVIFGCALVAEESRSGYAWSMSTWARAMGGREPGVLLTDHGGELKAAVLDAFPNTRHRFPLWTVTERVPEMLGHVTSRYGSFLSKFGKCVLGSVTDEQFDMRWWKMVGRFELQHEAWVRSLYEEREKWVPAFSGGRVLSGMSTLTRAEGPGSFLDRYIHRRMSSKELVRQYRTLLQNMYEAEAVADFDTWHKRPAVRSPSPWERQMSGVYTHAVFRRFQTEVLGVVGCHFRKLGDGAGGTFEVEDCEKAEKFVVEWEETTAEVSCSCRSFEYRGYLCRHAMIVLQIFGITAIPERYILKRWTKDAKCREQEPEAGRAGERASRYNELCRMGIEFAGEGSGSPESYVVALNALAGALKTCVDVNDRGFGGDLRDDVPAKRRKVPSDGENDVMSVGSQDAFRKTGSGAEAGLGRYCGPTQCMPGLVQLNLMEPPCDSAYHVNQQRDQGLGQLSSGNPSGQGGFFGSQQSIHELGHSDFLSSNTRFHSTGRLEYEDLVLRHG